MSLKDNIIWIDLEMTGLCPNNDTIIEIATVVTDSQLNVLADGPVFAIHQSNETLSKMDAWNQNQHQKSGLYARVQASQVTMDEAEAKTIAFLKEHSSESQSPMAGNSICQDRRFLVRYMPTLERWFHYRNLDVSSLKEIAKRWYPEAYQSVRKKSSHLALDDIYDSINELKHYREHLFK